MAVASFASSALSSVAGFAAQSQQADAQNAMWQQNYVNALAAERDTFDQLGERQMQEQTATEQKIRLDQITGARAAATTIVSGAASGVSGITMDSLLDDVDRRVALNESNAQMNYAMTAQQLQMQKTGAVDQFQSRVNSVQTAQDPNPLSLIAGLGGDAASAYGHYLDWSGISKYGEPSDYKGPLQSLVGTPYGQMYPYLMPM